jgi:hypothetical protein
MQLTTELGPGILEIAGLENLLTVCQQLGNIVLLQFPPDGLQIHQDLFHGLVARIDLFLEHAFDDGLHLERRARRNLG